MKLDTAEFKALFSPELTTLASLFKKYGYELRLAGGAVRLGSHIFVLLAVRTVLLLKQHKCDLFSYTEICL